MKQNIHNIQTNVIIGETDINFPFFYKSSNKINKLLIGEYPEVNNYVKIDKDKNGKLNSTLIIETSNCLLDGEIDNVIFNNKINEIFKTIGK